MKHKLLLLTVLQLLTLQFLYSQSIEINGQIRPRTEYRHGYKSLIDNNAEPAFLTTQRTRLNIGYTSPKIKAYISLQNHLIWGETALSSRADLTGTSVFQAYSEVNLSPEFSFKVGRQVFSYDDQKLLSVSDWNQVARRHDALLLKYEQDNFKVHIGAAYNQNVDKDTGTFYTVNNYKTLQFMWMRYDLNKFGASLYFINNGMPHNTIENEKEVQNIRFSQTFGPLFSWNDERFNAQASFYYQTGKSAVNRDLSAFLASAELHYNILENFKIGAGAFYLTGNNQDEINTEEKGFTSPFASGHKFHGSMDYFYASSPHQNVGLIDILIPITFKYKKLSTTLTAHRFNSSANIVNAQNELMDKYLGTEIDLNLSYKFNNDLTILCGYSQMFATKSLEKIKGGNSDNTQNWAWLTFSFTPTFFKN